MGLSTKPGTLRVSRHVNHLRNLKVGAKLSLGFGILLALILCSSALAIYQSTQIGKQMAVMRTNNQKMSLLYAMRLANSTNQLNMRDLLLASGEDLVAANAQIEQTRKAYQASWEQLDAIPHDAEGTRAKQAILATQGAARQMNDQIRALAAAGDRAAATALLYGPAEPLLDARAKAIAAAVALQVRRNAAGSAQVEAAVTHSRRALTVFMLVALVSGAVLAWLITRSLVMPIRRAMGVASAIAAGRFNEPVGPAGNDETGALLKSMDQMASRLRSYAAAQQEMAQRHEQGDLDHRIDAAQMPGDFGRMAEGTNALVSSSNAVTEQIIDVVGRYAVGDLARDMQPLPGQKARFTQAVAQTKQNLAAINREIHGLASAAAQGDFSLRGDESAFDFEFKVMIQRLNSMMQTSDDNLRQLSQLLQHVAAGDLTHRMDGQFEGVFATMRDDANATVAQLTAIIGSIQTAAASINTAASEIASGNNDLSRRTEQQAANLEETAASMEELTSTVRQNAEHAGKANTLSMTAAGVASDGGEVVRQVVATMTDIESSSKRIADIITVIDGIAFQTNILALNAAVEAARAGEQGRGFAVVASEVRSLAQRAAGAAKEIKELIEASVAKVETGAGLVARAGVTMDDIVASVGSVTHIMAEISSASAEQSAGIEQVSQTVVQLDEATQQNAALVEEATAAARAMEDQALVLSQAVARFRIAAGAGAPSVPADAHRRPIDRPRPTAAVVALKPAGADRPRSLSQPPVEAGWREF